MLRVYYIDDEASLCEVFREVYSSKEVIVETFTTHEPFLELSKLVPPDLFFLDYRLGPITGDELAKLLDPAIPKILITGENGVKPDYPFQRIIYKPAKRAEILSIFKELASAL